MKNSKLVLCASAVLLLASCGGGNQPAESSPASDPIVSSEQVSSEAAFVPTENIEVLVWCPEAAQALTEAQVQAFIDQKGWGDKVTFTTSAVSESSVAGDVLTDVEAAGDIYFFAQDQLSRLVTGGGLIELTDRYANPVKAENGAGSVVAATVGEKIYAFPATADNGYFLYYNKDILAEDKIGSWDALVAAAEGASKEVHFNYSSAWYNFGFFYGAGADSIWTTDDEGAFIDYNDTYASANGLKAAKGMAKLITSTACVDNSSAGGIGDNCAALVSGTWDYNAMVEAWGDKLGCAELPAYTVGEETIHTGSFSGNKLVGVKPQTDAQKARVTLDIAQYLTSEAGQLERFEELKWGPSNIAAADSDAVKAAPQIAALAKQNVYAKPQGQFPGKWWDNAGAIGSSIQALGKDGITDEAIQAVLDTYTEGLDELLSA